MTIHCGVLLEHLHLTVNRVTGIVSRGGSLIAKWMMAHNKQNPLYEHFDDLCDIMKQYDVTWSLGDGLRPWLPGGCQRCGSVCRTRCARTMREAKLEKGNSSHGRRSRPRTDGPDRHERAKADRSLPWRTVLRTWTVGDRYRSWITTISPAPSSQLQDGRPAAMLCYVTPKEHLGLPNREDVKQGVIAYKMPLTPRIGTPSPGARDRDDALSRARFGFDWNEQFRLSLDPETAKAYHDKPYRRTPSRALTSAHVWPEILLDENHRRYRKMASEKQIVNL